MRKLLIMASLLCVGTDLANAETIEKLRGLMSVRLIVPELDEDAKSCGLSQELVRDAVMFPASSSKLEFLDATGDGAVFEVVITTMVQERPVQCITNLAINVWIVERVKFDYAPDAIRYAAVTMWFSGAICVSVATKHPQMLRTAIENKTKKFLTDWNLANKPLGTVDYPLQKR
jgi:hypothetical protein